MFALGGFFGYSECNINIRKNIIMIIKIYNELKEVKIFEEVTGFARDFDKNSDACDLFQRIFQDEDDIKGTFSMEYLGVVSEYTIHPEYEIYVCNNEGVTLESIKVPA